MINIRRFQSTDTPQIAQLFHQTVREINCYDYSVEQVKAWAPDDIYFIDWQLHCANRITYIADQDNIILGFGQLEINGHIDCFYVHKNHQGLGIGKLIYQAVENHAISFHLTKIFTESSITGKPFFEKRGFINLQEQIVTCRGEKFINYQMIKFLK